MIIKPKLHTPSSFIVVSNDSTEPNTVKIVSIISVYLSKSDSNIFKVTDSKYFATKEPLGSISRTLATSSSGFSNLPFSNVYDSGSLCFGTAMKISSFTPPDLRGVHSYYQVLFDSAFNNDLGIKALKSGRRQEPVSKWYDYLATLAADKKPFPYKELQIY